MKTLVQKSGYILDSINNIWINSAYEGIAYSDGDEVETRIANIITGVSDISVLSVELRQHCTDWVSLYHLSSTRANIMRPFENILKGDVLEIGAGCGAITRYLGECGANILALEGSPRRAAIARSRTRDLENVTVLAEKFDQLQCGQFDVITLIGVLEYANLFTSGENPPLEMLKRIRSLLKPEGKLIIAIENQLGLKYFAGAPEDHLGQPMIGIEGRYSKNQPQTFGRKVLADMLKQAEFTTHEFLAPFPDYKLPVSILTEEGFTNKNFDAAAFAWQSVRRDPQLPTHCNFSLELAWPEIFKNKLGLDVANSFLIIASPNNTQQLIDNKILAYHYSTDRIPKYCKETIFICNNNENIYVKYQHLGVFTDDINKTDNSLIKFVCPDVDKYAFGKSLTLKFIDIVTKDGWSFEQMAQVMLYYLSIAEVLINSEDIQFSTISPYTELPGKFFDAVPHNIIIAENGNPFLIDKEWELVGSIEVGYLLFRSLLILVNSITKFGLHVSGENITRYQFIDGTLQAIELRLQEEDYVRYIRFEGEIQKIVTGRMAENFLNWGKDQLLPTLNLSQVVIKYDEQIAYANKIANERDEYIAALDDQIAARDDQIAALDDQIAARDDQIAARDEYIAALDDQIAARDDQVAARDEYIVDLKKTLTATYASRSYRMTKPLRIAMRWLSQLRAKQ